MVVGKESTPDLFWGGFMRRANRTCAKGMALVLSSARRSMPGPVAKRACRIETAIELTSTAPSGSPNTAKSMKLARDANGRLASPTSAAGHLETVPALSRMSVPEGILLQNYLAGVEAQ